MTALVNEIIEKALGDVDSKNNNPHKQGINRKGGKSYGGLGRNRGKNHSG